MSAASNTGSVDYINLEGLHQNPAFSQAVVVTGAVKTVYIGGQNAVDATGEIVGTGDFQAQSCQVLDNIQTCLAAAGAGFEHIVKLIILVVQGQPLYAGLAAFQEFFPAGARPPAVTVAFVAGLAHPDFLVEIDAIAVVPA